MPLDRLQGCAAYSRETPRLATAAKLTFIPQQPWPHPVLCQKLTDIEADTGADLGGGNPQ